MQQSARFGSTYTKIGTIQRRLAWPLRKDDTQIREAFHIFNKKKKNATEKLDCKFEEISQKIQQNANETKNRSANKFR